MYEIREKETERVILVGVCFGDEEDTKASMEELAELVTTAGAESAGMVIQNREQIHPGTYVGSGKIEEIREYMDKTQAQGIVCDDELTPAQCANLQDKLGCKIMDRTQVILHIFAQRARTKEGKIQVELAQLRYRQTRLTGLGKSLSRLGGGIGTRGPGEKKLEMDRRLIKNRIAVLNRELVEIERHRETSRGRRVKNHMPVAAIVGYTNAGKSTLLNSLTNADVFEEDLLFATLDPTTRALELSQKQQILLTDTVGFIRKLPHHLIQAFKSTLEEAKYADILLHVVDVSNPQMEKQMQTVYDTLSSLGIKGKKVITLMNKTDRLEGEIHFKDTKADKTLYISAKKSIGFEELKETLTEILRERGMLIERVFPFPEAGKIQILRKYGEVLEEEYCENGVYVKGYIPKELYAKLV